MSTQKFKNLVELYEQSVETYAGRELFGTKVGNVWRWMTYGEFGRLVDAFRAGLAARGIGKGDKIACISNNRVEWAVAAYATYSLGAVWVPMYEAQLEKEWQFIIKDCDAKALLVSTHAIYQRTKDYAGKVGKLEHVIAFEGPKDDANTYEAILAQGRLAPMKAYHPSGEEICGFIYTSGTTGEPKGVMLTHDNIASNVSAIHEIIDIEPDDRSLSFLPWAHSFGQTVELHGLLSMGAAMALAESVDKIVDNLAETRPTIIMSVPRIFNRIYDRVQKQIREKPKPIQKLVSAGVSAAKKRNAGGRLSVLEVAAFEAADRLVFEKVRGRFGGRLRYAVSGGAAISTEVAEFIDAIGVTVYEGYGLTETSPISNANAPGRRRLGSVGRAIPGVRIVIDKTVTGDPENGEIIIYGPNVMKGYHNRPEENAAVFTKDGGFRTGDMGRLDHQGYLYITGRIKEQYKLENGKYVVPTPLEEKLKLSQFIANVMVHGANKPYNVALIVPDMSELKEWANRPENGISDTSDDALLADPKVKNLIRQEIEQYSQDWKQFEKVLKFDLVKEDFSAQNGMLTPSLKLKRREVLKAYGDKIERLYGGGSKAEVRASI
ncbi:MAG: long-chain fatty acid--CoA ligase [Deltaproteobacteria bacterium]|nr:long-chain fatty acid--CoA ligase [Deltaproteobacteria bacterium]